MAIVEPGKGRAVIKHGGTGLHVTIPAATRNDLAASLLLALIFWLFAEVVLVYDLFSGRFAHDWKAASVFFLLILGLPAMTAISVTLLQWLLWQLAGEEIVRLDSTSLRQSKHSLSSAVAGSMLLPTSPICV